MTRRRREWTPDELKSISTRYNAGAKIKELCQENNAGESSILHALEQTNTPLRLPGELQNRKSAAKRNATHVAGCMSGVGGKCMPQCGK